MPKKKNIWKDRQGNICFRYENHSKWWIFAVMLFVILSIACATEYYINDTYFGVFPSILLFLFVTYFCACYSDNKADKTMLQLIGAELSILINQELACRLGAHEVKRKLYSQYQGTYGTVVSQSVLVLLSDNTVLEYPLIWHRSEDNSYYELQKECLVCSDQERVDSVRPRSLKDWFENIHISDDAKLRVLLFGILTLSFVVAAAFLWVFCAYGVVALLYFLCYVAAFVIISIIRDKVEYKAVSFVADVLLFPFYIVGSLIKLSQPILIMLFAFGGTPMFLCLIPYSLLKLTDIFIMDLSRPTIYFISMTFSAIICVHSRSVTRWMIRHSPMKDNGNHRYEIFNEQLALYITEPKNYNLVFSILYVVFLLCSGFCNIEYGVSFVSKEVESVLLKSFLVFIAFNTMMQRSKETELNIKDLFERVLGLFIHDYDTNPNRRNIDARH